MLPAFAPRHAKHAGIARFVKGHVAAQPLHAVYADTGPGKPLRAEQLSIKRKLLRPARAVGCGKIQHGFVGKAGQLFPPGVERLRIVSAVKLCERGYDDVV